MDAQTVESLAERVEGFQDEAYDSLGINGFPGGEEGERLERRVVGHVAALLERDPVIRMAPRAMLAAAVPLIEDDNAHCAAQALSDFLDKAGKTDGRGE